MFYFYIIIIIYLTLSVYTTRILCSLFYLLLFSCARNYRLFYSLLNLRVILATHNSKVVLVAQLRNESIDAFVLFMSSFFEHLILFIFIRSWICIRCSRSRIQSFISSLDIRTFSKINIFRFDNVFLDHSRRLRKSITRFRNLFIELWISSRVLDLVSILSRCFRLFVFYSTSSKINISISQSLHRIANLVLYIRSRINRLFYIIDFSHVVLRRS